MKRRRETCTDAESDSSSDDERDVSKPLLKPSSSHDVDDDSSVMIDVNKNAHSTADLESGDRWPFFQVVPFASSHLFDLVRPNFTVLDRAIRDAARTNAGLPLTDEYDPNDDVVMTSDEEAEDNTTGDHDDGSYVLKTSPVIDPKSGGTQIPHMDQTLLMSRSLPPHDESDDLQLAAPRKSNGKESTPAARDSSHTAATGMTTRMQSPNNKHVVVKHAAATAMTTKLRPTNDKHVVKPGAATAMTAQLQPPNDKHVVKHVAATSITAQLQPPNLVTVPPTMATTTMSVSKVKKTLQGKSLLPTALSSEPASHPRSLLEARFDYILDDSDVGCQNRMSTKVTVPSNGKTAAQQQASREADDVLSLLDMATISNIAFLDKDMSIPKGEDGDDGDNGYDGDAEDDE
ncbi:unnamed protein product [Zymoseptoria tritici ST99CH_3D1]|nr:unnamed protein product [Zymoseptoria tritici ST99CH_3D1]